MSEQQNKAKRMVIVGLDIGTTKIACLVGVKNDNGKIEILTMGHWHSAGVVRGSVINIDEAVVSIRKAINSAVERFGRKIDIEVVHVGIAGSHIQSWQNRGVKMRESNEDVIRDQEVRDLIEEMHRVAVPPGQEIVHVIPQEYIVDSHFHVNPIGMFGNRLEGNFHIVTGDTTAAKYIKTAVERAGLEIADMILEPIASAEAVLTTPEKEAGVVLVDIGGGTTDVAIFHDGILRHTAVIPFGGEIITKDIMEGCRLLKNYAEQLKIQFGSSIQAEAVANEVISIPMLDGHEPLEISTQMLAGIIQARMEEIIGAVNHEILTSGLERKLVAGIVVTGGGSQLKNIKQHFEYLTGMTTRLGRPTEHIAATKLSDAVNSPIYATGIGLVIYGFNNYERQHGTQKMEGKDLRERVSKEKGRFFDGVLKGSGKLINFFKDDEI
jgi:cell division protein FtsA